MNRKYDYMALETEFVQGTMSIRELARSHEIGDSRVSSIHAQAKKPDANGKTWYDKRGEFRARSSERTVAIMANLDAERRVRESAVVDKAIEVVGEALDSTLEQLQRRDRQGRRVNQISMRELTVFLKEVATLFGRSTESDGDNLPSGPRPSTDADPTVIDGDIVTDVFARFLAISRRGPRPAEPRRVGGSPLPTAEEARSN